MIWPFRNKTPESEYQRGYDAAMGFALQHGEKALKDADAQYFYERDDFDEGWDAAIDKLIKEKA